MEYRDILLTPSVAGTVLRAQGKKERRDESIETEESPSASVRPSVLPIHTRGERCPAAPVLSHNFWRLRDHS